MKITKVDALKIDSLLKQRSIDNIYFEDFVNLFGKNKYKNRDYLEYYINLIENFLNKDEIQYKQFNKYLFLLSTFFAPGHPSYNIDLNRIRNLYFKYKEFLERTNSEVNEDTEEYFKKINENLGNDLENDAIDKNENTQDGQNEQQALIESMQKTISENDKVASKQEKKIQSLEEKNKEKREKIATLQKTIRGFLKSSYPKKRKDFYGYMPISCKSI